MTTVINSPGSNEGSGAGLIIGVIIALVIIALFFVYGLPALRGNGGSNDRGTNINVQIPDLGGNGGDNGGSGGSGGVSNPGN